VQKDCSVLWRRRAMNTKCSLPNSRLLCVDRAFYETRLEKRSNESVQGLNIFVGRSEGSAAIQQFRDPRQPTTRFRPRIEVTCPGKPCHRIDWRRRPSKHRKSQ